MWTPVEWLQWLLSQAVHSDLRTIMSCEQCSFMKSHRGQKARKVYTDGERFTLMEVFPGCMRKTIWRWLFVFFFFLLFQMLFIFLIFLYRWKPCSLQNENSASWSGTHKINIEYFTLNIFHTDIWICSLLHGKKKQTNKPKAVVLF